MAPLGAVSHTVNFFICFLNLQKRDLLEGEENIRMILKEIVISARNWVDWDQDRNYSRALVNSALNLQVL